MVYLPLEKVMSTHVRLFLAAALFFYASAALAQHQTLTINPETSEVNFTLNGSDHATHGTFHVEKGSVDFDLHAPMIAGLVLVSVGSGKTGNDLRDKKMTTEVLDVAHFADVTFVPNSYQGTISPGGDSTIQVAGVFTLHGTPHDLTVPIQLHVDGANCTAKTTFTVPYVKWGLKDPSILIFRVAKEVQIDLKLVGSLSPAR